MNSRTHRKILVVDGRVGFIGGVGIADQWQGNAEGPEHWRDSHFQIDGPAVAHLQAAFLDNWLKIRREVLNEDDYFPELQSAGDALAQVFKSSPREGSGRRSTNVPDVDCGGEAANLDCQLLFCAGRRLCRCTCGRPKTERGGRSHCSGTAHRYGRHTAGITLTLGEAVGGGRQDLRVPTHDVPLQGDGRGRMLDDGWIHEF